MRREAWKTVAPSPSPGRVRHTRLVVAVELWPALLGWWVVQRYGRVTHRRWCWAGRAATALFDEAVAAAEVFAEAWPEAERRSVLPLTVSGR